MARRVHWTDDSEKWKGRFEGHDAGSGVSIIFARLEPGNPGPKLHTHPYSETFVVRHGQAIFTAGDERIPAAAGDIVVVPPETPHTFANTGSEVLETVNIHASDRFVMTWLEN